jgi:ribonucleoside-diphosphate reductase alpha chain
MGFAEMLIYLGISYASKKAIEFAQNLIQVISDEALKASQELAQERGVFPNWKGSIYERKGIKLRNAARLAIAPTGTISIIAGTSPSIEPLFALAYRKAHVLEGQTLYEPNPIFLTYLKDKEIETEGILEQVLHKGNLKELERIPQNIKRLFITALEISPEKHIQIQASFQHYVDNSVSKTINMPEDTPCKDIAKTYMRAWELGLKGITVYRYGSKSAQVLELGTDEEADYIEHTAQCDPHECKL